MLDLEVVQVRCQCGKMANEVAWDDDATHKMLFNMFGSLDDHYYFICECGEVIRMHYTGYDCLLDNLAYDQGVNSNEDAKILAENGCWVYETRTNLSEKVGILLAGYRKFHEFEAGNEKIKVFRKDGGNLQFIQLVYNVVHENFELYNYRVDDDKVLKIVQHFGKVGK